MATQKNSPLRQHHFLLRRLHSLSGIVPIGVFLILHLTTNATILWGVLNSRAGSDMLARRVGTFQEEVSFINGLPALLLIELTLWISLGFHSILGVYYAFSGRPNVREYPYPDNWRYTLQRVSGYVGILFIFYHVATLRWGWSFLVPGGTQWSHNFAASTLAAAMQGSEQGYTVAGIAVSLFYFVGVSLLVYHFANGLWTAAITWGLTISEQAQKRWGFVCAGLGAGMMLLAWASIIGFATLDYDAAAEIEGAMHSETNIPAAAQSHADNTNP